MTKRDWNGQLPMALFPNDLGNMGKLEIQFWEFHRKNPIVYKYLVQFAFQWRMRRGNKAQLGMKALFERVRWQVSMGKTTGDFKLNNNHTAFYARLLMRNNPKLQDMFKVRRQRIQSTLGPSNEGLPSGEQVS